MTRKEHVEAFVEEIWMWFAQHRRSLPWRDLAINDETERAYQILVSEVMLQQTQVPRVVIIFKRFLETFPTLQDLAQASNRDVLIVWRGMGYNSRALRLRDAAKIILEDFSGVFPKTMEELQSIKGIGHYTAAAIRNFAFGIPTPCLDTNIRRVLHRTFIGAENVDGTWRKDDTYLLKLAGEVLEEALSQKSEIPVRPARPRSGGPRPGGRNPKSEKNPNDQKNKYSKNISDFEFRASDFRRRTAEWHAALMDFGSLIQSKKNPRFDICPLSRRGLIKAHLHHFEKRTTKNKKHIRQKQIEPGRFVGSVFIPNRIFRGKIVEELRDAKRGLPLHELGKRVCLDWKSSEHWKWLTEILLKLEREEIVESRGRTYVLKG